MEATLEKSVELAGMSYPFSIWNGEILDSPFGFDTETEVVEDRGTTPRVALCTVSDGRASYLFPPSSLSSFLFKHRNHEWICHNIAFDFWVVHRELERRKLGKRLETLWSIADRGGFVDTMLLDELIRLARYDAYPSPRNLSVVASEYAGISEINKEDPWRMRYGELIDVPPGRWPIEAQEYAVKDAIVTILAYNGMLPEAIERSERAEVSEETRKQWGPLTVGIQTRAAIAFGGVERSGIAIDTERVGDTQRGLNDRLEAAAKTLRDLPYSEGLFTRDKKTGELKRTASGTPSLSTKILRGILQGVATDIEMDTGCELDLPRTPKGEISASVPEWEDYRDRHPFLGAWADMQELGKLLQFFTRLEGKERVHPRYTTMVRTGRTSARDPNIQQIPRTERIRESFRATGGYLLAQIDYSFIELRTLAAVCESIYGYSQLAQVIRGGIDPHVFTAAMVNDIPIEEFIEWKKSRPDGFKEHRQSAKAVNFGIPGGLGPTNLAKYAHRTYGVSMTVERAKELRDRIITEVYPEWEGYLSEDSWSIMSRSIGCDRAEMIGWLCREGIPSAPIAGGIRKILVGNPFKANGEAYNPEWVDKVWQALAYLNNRPELQEMLDQRQAGIELMRAVAYSPVKTLTGRVRGRVSYSQARNTPFQGLASDGAKLAIYRLVREGFRVVGFVHDEILIELPEERGSVSLDQLRYVESVMTSEMQRVCPSLPIEVESAIGIAWSKSAGIRIEGDRAFPL